MVGRTDADEIQSWEGKQGKPSVLDVRVSDGDGGIFSGGMEVLPAGEPDEGQKEAPIGRSAKQWERDRALGDEEMVSLEEDGDHKLTLAGITTGASKKEVNWSMASEPPEREPCLSQFGPPSVV
ncbi:hypothetical protein ACA910_007282 [Epithemia clementina (nom. ined.)]